MKAWLGRRVAARVSGDITIFGENLAGWKEIGSELVGWAALWVFRVALLLAALYGLVKFLKWAWYN